MIDSAEPAEAASPEDDGQPRQGLNRVLYSLGLISFFFPFAIVKGCGGEERSYTGFELMLEEAGVLLVGVLLLGVLLFALSFRVRVLTSMRRGLVQAAKALLCALALLTTLFATGMTFMFDRVSEQFGFYLCTATWGVLYLLSMVPAVRRVVTLRRGCREPPPPVGLALGILLAVAHGVTIWSSEPDGVAEVAVGLTMSLLVVAPLMLMALTAAVHYRRRHPRSLST